jgi:ankyrin repeat protein
VEVITEDKETCLHQAALKGFADTVSYLVQAFKNIIDFVNVEGRTALHIAAGKGYFTVVQHLVEAKANVHITDKYKKTALDVASENNRREIVEYLQKCNQK